MPASAPVLQRLASRAASDGFALRRSMQKASPFDGTRRFAADRGRGRAGGLSVEIATRGTTPSCEPRYGRTLRAAPGTVLVDLTLSLDSAPSHPA